MSLACTDLFRAKGSVAPYSSGHQVWNGHPLRLESPRISEVSRTHSRPMLRKCGERQRPDPFRVHQGYGVRRAFKYFDCPTGRARPYSTSPHSHTESPAGQVTELIKLQTPLPPLPSPGLLSPPATRKGTVGKAIAHSARQSAIGFNSVIPGRRVRAGPGTQAFLNLSCWIPGSAARTRNDVLTFL